MNDLIRRVEQYKQERGYYPERVCADAKYITVENKRYFAEHNIRLSGRGRSKRIESPTESAKQQNLFKSDLRKRSVIEGRIGTSKRKYGLNLIMTKLVEISRSIIGMTLFVMNTEKILRLLSLLLALFVYAYMMFASMTTGEWHLRRLACI